MSTSFPKKAAGSLDLRMMGGRWMTLRETWLIEDQAASSTDSARRDTIRARHTKIGMDRFEIVLCVTNMVRLIFAGIRGSREGKYETRQNDDLDSFPCHPPHPPPATRHMYERIRLGNMAQEHEGESAENLHIPRPFKLEDVGKQLPGLLERVLGLEASKCRNYRFLYGKGSRLGCDWRLRPFIMIDQTLPQISQVAVATALWTRIEAGAYCLRNRWPKFMGAYARMVMILAARIQYRDLSGTKRALVGALPSRASTAEWSLESAGKGVAGFSATGALTVLEAVPELGTREVFTEQGREWLERHFIKLPDRSPAEIVKRVEECIAIIRAAVELDV